MSMWCFGVLTKANLNFGFDSAEAARRTPRQDFHMLAG